MDDIMERELTETEKAIGIVVTIALIGLGVFFYLKPWNVEQMYVVDKRWRYTIEECEDYTPIDCSTECDSNTRVHNVWNTEGNYSTEPYWPTGYTIRHPYYERKSTWFAVWFKTGNKVRVYKPWNYGDYSRLKRENVYLVTTNIFGIATKVTSP